MVDIIADQVYATPGGSAQRADLYLPAAARGTMPVILWLHGGGFRIGDRTLAPDLARFFAERGFAMVSIDYRLSGQAVFPAAIEDVKAALGWLRTVADRYGLDPERVGLWGSSAGGYLAAMAALTPGGLFAPAAAGPSASIRAVVPGYPPVDFLQMDAHRDELAATSDDPETRRLGGIIRSAAPDSREALFLGAPIDTVPERVRDANPVTYVTAGAPPFLIMHGTNDPVIPAHQSELLYEALAAAGNDVTLALVEGLGHAFFDRTDLDDAGGHAMRIRRGGRERRETGGVFATVESFFARHLRNGR